MGLPVGDCRAVLTSDSDPIEVWLVTNNDPVPKPEAETADRLQLPLPPQPPEQPGQVALADSSPAPDGQICMHPLPSDTAGGMLTRFTPDVGAAESLAQLCMAVGRPMFE